MPSRVPAGAYIRHGTRALAATGRLPARSPHPVPITWWGAVFSARSGREVPDGPRLPRRMERAAGPKAEAIVEQAQEEPQERERLPVCYGEYFVVDSYAGEWIVSRVMAQFIEGVLDAWPRSRWIRFVDITGARVRVRAELIRSLRQSSAEIRGEWRRFKQERQKESGDEPTDWDVDW